MSRGDYKTFDSALQEALENWDSADEIYLAICDNTAAPTVSTATPALGDFTEVGSGGTYPSGGYSLGTWKNILSTTGGGAQMVVKLDSTTTPICTEDGSNDTDAYWGIVYNNTQGGDPALGFLDLGGPVDLQTERLTITWNASGITTITRA